LACWKPAGQNTTKQKGKLRFPSLLPFIAGAGDESRTRDLNLGKVALYQLSYSRAVLQNRSTQTSVLQRITFVLPEFCTA
jgi:hypothetical protein